MAMSDQPVITIDFSRILIEQGRYIQTLNLNRIINELEAEKIISSLTAMGLRGVNDEYEKSGIVTGILQGRNEKDFKTFIKIIAKEEKGSKFNEATKMFFSAFTMFPGYEQYATWPDVQLSTCGFTQIGNGIVNIGVRREGAILYDSIHGGMLYVAEDSLPDGIDEVTITMKHGFNACKLDASMQTCSATVYFETKPMVIEFTKDVFIEIPHSFSSLDMQELCFVKFHDDMDATGSGEILLGLFPAEYPYGVIATRTFSSYKISTKKQFQNNKLEKKSRVRKLRPEHLRSEAKITKSKELQLVKKESSVSHTVDHGLIPNAYWFSITESIDKRTVFLSMSQFTPTGYKTTLQSKEERTVGLSQLVFQSCELVCHPQTANDGDWTLFACDKKYKIKKSEVDSSAHRVVVKYQLSPVKVGSLTNPCIPVTVTGGNNVITYHITDVNPDATVSIIDDELLHKLYAESVQPNAFLQQLACKLPFWQPVARLLGLSELDVKEIEADYPKGQREDGSFLPVFKGEQAYQALLKWMQTKGCDATYGELLVALHNALLSNDNITDAWWYAYNELTHSMPL